MEENIIVDIAKAEEEGARRRAEGTERARLLLADAEERSSEILKKAETDRAILRANGIRKAESASDAAYEHTLALAAKDAKEYADGLLGHTETYVAEIVGRILK